MFKQIGTAVLSSGVLALFAASGAIAAAEPDNWTEAWVDADAAWQMELLFDPAAGQMRREQRGSVFIYSGLKESVVERALDEQFDRIEHMLFIRTVHTNKEGEVELEVGADGTTLVVVQDDDC